MPTAEADLRNLCARIREQIEGAQRRNHGRLLAVLIDVEALVEHYRRIVVRLVREAV